MATQHHRIPHTPWRKSRHCYNAKGNPKRRMTMEEARQVRAALRNQGDDVEMYVCELCHFWHCGHRRKDE